MSDTIKIVFNFDDEAQKKRLTWYDLKTMHMMRAGSNDPERLQLFVSRFMVDENKQYLPKEKAIAILDELTQDEIEQVLAQFTAAVQESAIPNLKGGESKPPSEPVTPTSESLTGSEL